MVLGMRPPCLSHLDSVLKHWVTLQPNRGVSIVIDLIVKRKNTLWYWRWGKYSVSVSSPDNGVIVSFFLWLVTSFKSSSFFPSLWVSHGTHGYIWEDINTPFIEAPWVYQPIRMRVIILKGMEMKGNTASDMWVRFKVGGVSASLGPSDRGLLLSPECVTPLCLIQGSMWFSLAWKQNHTERMWSIAGVREKASCPVLLRCVYVFLPFRHLCKDGWYWDS